MHLRETYVPPNPSSVSAISLRELIDGVRPIPDQQQQRFGFDKGKAGILLWCAGDVSLVKRQCVAIVGTRNISDLGVKRTRRLAGELAETGVVVVSGLAKGVDTEALKAAIEAGGRVIAVIGTPITKAYPAENRQLHEVIYRDHLLISQFPEGRTIYKANFPERNKLMAAISDATVIIEAGETSGTLHQAKECERLGRLLFIAKSLLETDLEWPRRFQQYEKTKVLKDTSDVLHAIGQT